MEIDLRSPSFSCDLAAPAMPLHHSWKHTVGSGHATLALRSDWQKQIARCHRELGFGYVRFHGLLCDDVGTLICENDQLVYSFFNADQIFDYLLSIGMRPFVELSFMPSTLSSGVANVFHYKANVTPPKDYDQWETLIKKLVHHWVLRYGLEEVGHWFFEVWNEPNLQAFWTGTQEDYFRLYRHAAQAIKMVSPTLRVGGPATAQNAWIPEFLDYCEENEIPVDFISTHHYPTDAFGKPDDDTVSQLEQSRRGILLEQTSQTTKESRGKPVYYTEWSTSSNPFDELHDLPYAAAYIIKTVLEGRNLVKAYSYWTFSDIFEERYFSSVPFHGGFGLLTIHGIPKPAYRAYELLNRLGNVILPVEGEHETVDAWVARKKNIVNVMITNSQLPRHEVFSESVKIELKSIKAVKSVIIERIDGQNANSYQSWLEMGRPQSLSAAQVTALETASLLQKKPLPFRFENGTVFLETVLMPQGTACLTLEIE